MVGKGSYMAVAWTRALMAQRNADGGIRVYIALTVPEDWVTSCGLDWADASGTKEQILNQYYAQWSDSVTNLVRESDLSEKRLWPLYDTLKPTEGGKWETNLGLTLIGDAAHVMPPWTG
jgi:2-polyprenyl-6-methoxyphenol hydroxylase-like FAD-dependent oxidoreductase